MLASFFVTIVMPLVGREANDKRLYVHQDILQMIDEYLGY